MNPFVLPMLSVDSSAHTLTGRDCRLLTSMNTQPGLSFRIQQRKVATLAKYTAKQS